MAGGGARPRRGGEGPESSGVAQELEDRVRERGIIVRRNQESGPTLLDELRQPADRGGDDGPSVRHPLQGRAGHRLAPDGWNHTEGGRGDPRGDRWHVPRARHRRADSEAGRLALEVVRREPFRASYEGERGRGDPCAHAGGRAQKGMVALDRIEPAEHRDDRTGRGVHSAPDRGRPDGREVHRRKDRPRAILGEAIGREKLAANPLGRADEPLCAGREQLPAGARAQRPAIGARPHHRWPGRSAGRAAVSEVLGAGTPSPGCARCRPGRGQHRQDVGRTGVCVQKVDPLVSDEAAEGGEGRGSTERYDRQTSRGRRLGGPAPWRRGDLASMPGRFECARQGESVVGQPTVPGDVQHLQDPHPRSVLAPSLVPGSSRLALPRPDSIHRDPPRPAPARRSAAPEIPRPAVSIHPPARR